MVSTGSGGFKDSSFINFQQDFTAKLQGAGMGDQQAQGLAELGTKIADINGDGQLSAFEQASFKATLSMLNMNVFEGQTGNIDQMGWVFDNFKDQLTGIVNQGKQLFGIQPNGQDTQVTPIEQQPKPGNTPAAIGDTINGLNQAAGGAPPQGNGQQGQVVGGKGTSAAGQAVIGNTQLPQALQNAGVSNPQTAQLLTQAADKNKDGQVSREEMQQLFAGMKDGKLSDPLKQQLASQGLNAPQLSQLDQFAAQNRGKLDTVLNNTFGQGPAVANPPAAQPAAGAAPAAGTAASAPAVSVGWMQATPQVNAKEAQILGRVADKLGNGDGKTDRTEMQTLLNGMQNGQVSPEMKNQLLAKGTSVQDMQSLNAIAAKNLTDGDKTQFLDTNFPPQGQQPAGATQITGQGLSTADFARPDNAQKLGLSQEQAQALATAADKKEAGGNGDGKVSREELQGLMDKMKASGGQVPAELQSKLTMTEGGALTAFFTNNQNDLGPKLDVLFGPIAQAR